VDGAVAFRERLVGRAARGAYALLLDAGDVSSVEIAARSADAGPTRGAGRFVGGHVVLEEAHGVEGPSGPRVFLREVPFPSIANRAFTPFTIPSSRSMMGGGAAVYITNIERREDGRVTFSIGYEYF